MLPCLPLGTWSCCFVAMAHTPSSCLEARSERDLLVAAAVAAVAAAVALVLIGRPLAVERLVAAAALLRLGRRARRRPCRGPRRPFVHAAAHPAALLGRQVLEVLDDHPQRRPLGAGLLLLPLLEGQPALD